ncbi:MAG: AAA family ATPase [Pirellulaceae bacterium]
MFEQIQASLATVMAGATELIEQIIITIVCGSHAQLEGAPGVAKWLAVQSIGCGLGLTVGKLRGSPDLLAEDLVPEQPPAVATRSEGLQPVPESREGGASAASSGSVSRTGVASPLFRNLVLVDGGEWLAPKVHNLLQQAMQEREVLVRGQLHPLPNPFSLFAARYPRDDEAVPPTESLMTWHDDRFLFRIAIPFPAYHDEYALGHMVSSPAPAARAAMADPAQVLAWQEQVRALSAAPPVIHYAVRLVRATRVHEGENPDFIYEWVQRGAGPRAVESLITAAKGRALIYGRKETVLADVRSVAYAALRHRIVLNQNARSNGITVERVIRKLLEDTPPRVQGDDQPPRRGEALTFHDWIPLDDETA